MYIQTTEKMYYVLLLLIALLQNPILDIQEIKKIDRGKILIEVNSAIAANRLVENSVFIEHNLHVFIPAFKILRTSIN